MPAPRTPRLALGTVQLGLPYGAANRTGLPSAEDAIALIRAAVDAGIGVLDTARAYGEAEQRIGAALGERDDIVVATKLDPLAGVASTAAPGEAVAAAHASLEASRAALRRDQLPVVLLHRAAHRLQWNGAVRQLLRDARAAGTIGRIGVSVQSPSELMAALDDVDVTHVQLPFNILDHRWRDGAVRLRARPDVTVHARSVFLQGLLAAPARWPRVAGVDPDATRRLLAETARQLGRADIADLALAFVRAQDWIDALVIGMETRAQLDSNLAAFTRAPLAPEGCAMIERLPPVPEKLLDPAQWDLATT
jgi:aryl-alcohol dehydrogenase-like predicted oxidoreductase